MHHFSYNFKLLCPSIMLSDLVLYDLLKNVSKFNLTNIIRLEIPQLTTIIQLQIKFFIFTKLSVI